MVGVWLSILDHDPFALWCTSTKFRTGGEHFLHHSPRVLGGCEIEIQVTLHRVDTADARHVSDLCFDLFGHLLSALRHWQFIAFASAGFICRGLEEGSGNAPF